jgi:hypothetical protein
MIHVCKQGVEDLITKIFRQNIVYRKHIKLLVTQVQQLSVIHV